MRFSIGGGSRRRRRRALERVAMDGKRQEAWGATVNIQRSQEPRTVYIGHIAGQNFRTGVWKVDI